MMKHNLGEEAGQHAQTEKKLYFDASGAYQAGKLKAAADSTPHGSGEKSDSFTATDDLSPQSHEKWRKV